MQERAKVKTTMNGVIISLQLKNFDWTKDVLIYQINKTYEKYLLGQTNFDTTFPD